MCTHQAVKTPGLSATSSEGRLEQVLQNWEGPREGTGAGRAGRQSQRVPGGAGAGEGEGAGGGGGGGMGGSGGSGGCGSLVRGLGC